MLRAHRSQNAPLDVRVMNIYVLKSKAANDKLVEVLDFRDRELMTSWLQQLNMTLGCPPGRGRWGSPRVVMKRLAGSCGQMHRERKDADTSWCISALPPHAPNTSLPPPMLHIYCVYTFISLGPKHGKWVCGFSGRQLTQQLSQPDWASSNLSLGAQRHRD